MRETRAIHGLGIDILLMKVYKVKMMFASDSCMQISYDADPCAETLLNVFLPFISQDHSQTGMNSELLDLLKE